MMKVQENEISLRKWSGVAAHRRENTGCTTSVILSPWLRGLFYDLSSKQTLKSHKIYV